MTLSAGDVAHVAMLARLGLANDEREALRHQLDAILDHISALEAVDTSNVAETARVDDRVNAWRGDVVEPGLDVAAALGNAPHREGDHVVVGAIQ